MNKTILFLTGTRADFGKLRPLIDIIITSKKFEYYIFVTGMHTLSKYGSTFHEVKDRGYEKIFVYMNQTKSTDPDIILSNTIIGLGNFVKEVSPDLIVVHGDRVEALAGAIVGSFNNILVAHIEGGEISGTLDELIRHSITKLSHIHFVSNKKAMKRLIQMGEIEKNIHVIGSPDIEIMKSGEIPNMNTVNKHYKIPFKNYSVFIFHPVTSELELLKIQIKNIIDALIESNNNFIVIYPNNDKGSEIIINEFKRIRKNKKFKIYSSIRFNYFLSILKNSNLVIGNSSVGIRESEIFEIPSVDIGSRQQNRAIHPEIIHVNPNKKEILNAINKSKNKKIRCINSFGDGVETSKKFLNILEDIKTWETPIQKQFKDI
ncbi:MAG: UDP-N-acetylglucosamine 2-epimerase (hydrolyzing) [Thaumarchaeota archaeon]|nr:MAG: UDP-N-acetylglucosamine 2-epimerase (hydrolyzing) [Nitrososphaerota archaeon]